MNYCLLIPHYNHERQFLQFLPQLMATGLPCVIVDDGSDAASLQQVQDFVALHPQLHLFSMRVNRGKGSAVRSGFCHARALGFTHAIQIDADGQHDLGDLPAFIAASEANPTTIICGKPVFDSSAPKARVYGRKITDFWVALETLSLRIKDGLCGYRVYPITQIESVLDAYYLGSRMDFDSEILVKAVWAGIDLKYINTRVVYPEQAVSHFNYLRDNLMLIRLHTRLMLGMLVRFPWLLLRRLRGL